MVDIGDINDNIFYFIFGNISYVFEYVLMGDVVIIVFVVDLDVGSNSEVSFSFVNNGLVFFIIGLSDGVL